MNGFCLVVNPVDVAKKCMLMAAALLAFIDLYPPFPGTDI